MFLGEKYGKKAKTNNWIGLPMGGSTGPLVYRKSAGQGGGLRQDSRTTCRLPQALPGAEEEQQAGRLRARQRGRRRQRLRQLAAVGARRQPGRRERQGRASTARRRSTALELRQGALSDLHPGHDVVGRHQQQPRLSPSNELFLTSNGVSLYFALKNDPATKAIADDTEHASSCRGVAGSAADVRARSLNGMVLQAHQVPERGQGLSRVHDGSRAVRSVADRLPRLLVRIRSRPTTRARCGRAIPRSRSIATRWITGTGLATRARSRQAAGTVQAEYIMVQMFASVASGQATAGSCRQGSGAPHQALLPLSDTGTARPGLPVAPISAAEGS